MYVCDLSFDPRDPMYKVPGLDGVSWGAQVFTVDNGYGVDSDAASYAITGTLGRLESPRLRTFGQQRAVPGSLEVSVRADEDNGALWSLKAHCEEPIKSIKLMLRGLPTRYAAEGWWQAVDSPGSVARPSPALPLLWQYPGDWLTPWACAGDSSGGAVLSIRDTAVGRKRLYVHQPPYAGFEPVVEVVCEADASHFGLEWTSPEIRLHICGNKVQVRQDFVGHLAHLESAYSLQPWEKRADCPEWLKRIRLVLNLHGQHWTGYVMNNFDDMAAALQVVTEYVPGEELLAYVLGWEGRYYYQYPLFSPGEEMGGEEGFRRFLAVARELKVQVMPMFGANGANVLKYPEWERSTFRSLTNRSSISINYPDWDTDRSGEDTQVFLNPGEATFRQHLVEVVTSAVSSYDLGAVYLDTTAAWFNDPRFNLFEGYRSLIAELRSRHPALVVMGEGWYDALLGLFPVNQSWFGSSHHYRFPELLARYARVFSHVVEGAPGEGSTGVHERGFRQPGDPFALQGYAPFASPQTSPGQIPSINIVDTTLGRYRDDFKAFLSQLGSRHAS